VRDVEFASGMASFMEFIMQYVDRTKKVISRVRNQELSAGKVLFALCKLFPGSTSLNP
jgi:hypothetical protein